MSKNGSEREFIFSLYLKENISILEKELNLNLVGVELETKYAGLKIDMYGIEQDLGVEVYVENLLLKSDNSHQLRLLKLIEQIDNKGIIIYQAIGFHNRHVKQLREAILNSNKEINLLFVKINSELLHPLDVLNCQTHKLKVYENLSMLNAISNPIELLKDISIINSIKGDKVPKGEKEGDFTKREDVNNYLLEQLKDRIPYFLPFQRRKCNLDTRVISCGFGKSGVSLLVTVEDMYRRAFVKLRFTEFSPPIYYKIKEREENAREIIGEELEFLDDKHTITYSFQSKGKNVKEIVDRLVDIAEKFILTFSNDVLYGEDRFGMMKELKYSCS